MDYIKKKIPTICFPRGIKSEYVNFCSYAKPDCISIDYDVDPQRLKTKYILNCNSRRFRPKGFVFKKENIKKNVEKYLNIFKNYPYIFNLGHGVLPRQNQKRLNMLLN